MRKWIYTVLPVLLLIGCTTVPSVEKEEPAVEPEKKTEIETEKEQPKKKAEKIITETEYLLVREESSSADGFIDRYIDFFYEEEGLRRTEEREYGLDNTLEKVMVYEYGGDQLQTIRTFDGTGSLVSYHQYEYDSAGMLISDSLYTAKEELQVRSLYEYDGKNRKVRWIVLNSDENAQAYTDYIYGSYPLPDKIEMYSSAGNLEGYVENEFDSQGLQERQTFREADGSVWKYIEYEYSNGLLVEERHYRGNKALFRQVSYEYDDNGNVSVVIYSGPGGVVQDKKTKFYTPRNVQRVVVE